MVTTTAALEELVDSTVSIPTIPSILNEINLVFASAEGSAKDAAKVIEKDPAIATRVLRLVNSSFYGLKSPVSAIHLACSIVGLKVIRNVVVQATVMGIFGKLSGPEGFDPEWLWDHSFKTAMAARLLAQKSPLGKALGKDDAYTCGLIHDIGKMVLLDAQTEQFGEALKLSRESGIPLAQAESEVFGFHHAQVGGLLAMRWKLPETVQAGVMFHHGAVNPDENPSSFLIKAANTLAHRAKANAPYRLDVLDQDAMDALELSDDDLDEILESVRTATKQS
jgi:putative nucleotidyltransferase with HDIG domain